MSNPVDYLGAAEKVFAYFKKMAREKKWGYFILDAFVVAVVLFILISGAILTFRAMFLEEDSSAVQTQNNYYGGNTSSSISMNYFDPVTDPAYNIMSFLMPYTRHLDVIECGENVGTSTIKVGYANSLIDANAGIFNQIIVPEMTCGKNSNSTTTFLTPIIPELSYLMVAFTKVEGKPARGLVSVRWSPITK